MWCGMHFKKGKIRFDKKYAAILHPAKKIWEKILWISGVAAAAAISGIVVMNQMGNTKGADIKIDEPEPIPVVVDTERFNRVKANAIKNFDFAQKMDDSDYYTDALIYCDSALSIIPNDMEMTALKEKIKTRIK
jgi:hypothetical protein